MPKRTILITRKPFTRKGYYIYREGKRIYIPPTRVKATTYYAIDRGAKGKGKKVIPPLRKGLMTKVANEMGYERVTDIPDSKIDEFVDKLVKKYGEKKARGMIWAQIIFRKREKNHAKSKFEKMYKAWQKKYKD